MLRAIESKARKFQNYRPFGYLRTEPTHTWIQKNGYLRRRAYWSPPQLLRSLSLVQWALEDESGISRWQCLYLLSLNRVLFLWSLVVLEVNTFFASCSLSLPPKRKHERKECYLFPFNHLCTMVLPCTSDGDFLNS